MMMKSIKDRAIDPRQYDQGEVIWSQEGHGLSHIRRLFLENLDPYLARVEDKRVLDLGCGQGWLTAELTNRGAKVTGVDPSEKNIQAARQQYPDLNFEIGDLLSYKAGYIFDMVTAIMVFEHFPDLETAYRKISGLLHPKGELLLIAGDFEKFTNPRFDYELQTEIIGPGETATRTDYGERAGVIYDINRTAERFTSGAELCGFTLRAHEPLFAPDWMIEEQPRYGTTRDKPLFQLLDFEAQA